MGLGEDKQRIRHTQGRRLCEQGAETGAMQPEAKNARGGWGPAETARWQGRVPPQSLQREHGAAHLDFGLPASRTERESISRFKPPSLWYFVIAALGNAYKWPWLFLMYLFSLSIRRYLLSTFYMPGTLLRIPKINKTCLLPAFLELGPVGNSYVNT